MVKRRSGLRDRSRGEIQLVVSDVVMPRLNGPEAFRRISEHRPNLKAIFITGYAENALEIKSADPSL